MDIDMKLRVDCYGAFDVMQGNLVDEPASATSLVERDGTRVSRYDVLAYAVVRAAMLADAVDADQPAPIDMNDGDIDVIEEADRFRILGASFGSQKLFWVIEAGTDRLRTVPGSRVFAGEWIAKTTKRTVH